MNIGQASRASGVTRQDDPLLRERRPDPAGGAARCPTTGPSPTRDVNELRFIKRGARAGLLGGGDRAAAGAVARPRRSSREVKAIALSHVADLDARIAEMQAMADTLRHLAHACAGDDRPECPILGDLEAGRR